MVDRYVDRPDNNQPEELTDNLLEDNDLKYPKIVPLMSSKKNLHCRKVPFVLRYHVPNKHK